MVRKVLDWLEERTGVESAVKHFMNEDIPNSAGWHQVLGSVAMFAFLTQVVTGILLACNYAPTPGEAYNSLRYIMTELTAGTLMRGLHHWGASLMIIIVVLHMIQVFIWQAYKKPRETTWLVGCVLLLITLAFGLSGYLLPWDNRAYWGTTVTTQIMATAPGAGPYLLRLLGSESGNIGVVTFARFYAAHVLLLPPITMLLIGIHLYLVRRHGVTPAPGDERLPKKKFFPQQVFKDTLATFVWFCVLMGMAILARVPLGHVADPTDTNFIPRPEWYFLFLFQMLKVFEGPLEIVGTLILPTLAILTLFLIPFIDRARMVRIRQRTVAISAVVLGGITWAGLTGRAVATTPPSQEVDMALVQPWQEIPADELAAIGYFRKDNCGSCHLLGKAGAGPDLTQAVSTKPNDWLIQHFTQPVPNAAPTQLKPAQLRMLATFVAKRSDRALDAWETAPDSAAEGAMVYASNNCGVCHQLNGVGMQTGPALDGLSDHRKRDWVEQHFSDPAKFSPGSKMPPYKFTAQDLERITTYLMQIPKA
ncbi:MAG: cytochrome b N-terminal domain-containing protein [Bryobacteraceae bacterium]|jgi:ubiquinol-cytochrome c reductase cytochrome b subunit